MMLRLLNQQRQRGSRQARQNNLRHRLPNDTWLVQARIDILPPFNPTTSLLLTLLKSYSLI
jgi:hypothetical protein